MNLYIGSYTLLLLNECTRTTPRLYPAVIVKYIRAQHFAPLQSAIVSVSRSSSAAPGNTFFQPAFSRPSPSRREHITIFFFFKFLSRYIIVGSSSGSTPRAKDVGQTILRFSTRKSPERGAYTRGAREYLCRNIIMLLCAVNGLVLATIVVVVIFGPMNYVF